MDLIIIGNGILALSTAYKITKADPNIKIKIIGPADQKGCASLAAAAMFNSFAEIDAGTINNATELKKFEFNKASTPFWKNLLSELSEESGLEINRGFGTFVINNHASDELEDRNFDAIIAALKQYKEPYDIINVKEIHNYKPSSAGRAARGMYIPSEGWVNPIQLIQAYIAILKTKQQVTFIDSYCKSIYFENNEIKYAELESGEKISGDNFLLSPGAAFTKIISNSNLTTTFPKVFYGIGCSLLLDTKSETLQNCIRTPNRGLACGVYSAPQSPTQTLIGASNLISPEPADYGRVTSVYTLLKSAMEQINTNYYAATIVKINIGWRPTSADTLPMIGKTSVSNLFVATGTKRDGLHCSPIISDYITAAIIGKPDTINLDSYKPERKLVRFYTREEAIDISVNHTLNAAYQHDFVPSKDKMIDELKLHFRNQITELHNQVGANDWGIPPELLSMYKYGHITADM
ncbi:MAG: hypothetical protein RI955_832 [Bacteroidota bacterium]|jgi:glycine/D-amino acid oxidase-like deaminating enzyme